LCLDAKRNEFHINFHAQGDQNQWLQEQTKNIRVVSIQFIVGMGMEIKQQIYNIDIAWDDATCSGIFINVEKLLCR
jgi:hypothetical protein